MFFLLYLLTINVESNGVQDLFQLEPFFHPILEKKKTTIRGSLYSSMFLRVEDMHQASLRLITTRQGD